MDSQTQAVLARARGGDIGGAIESGEALLARGGGDGAFAMFIGMLCCRQGDLARGIPHLRRAAEAAPNEPGVRVELARALIAAGENEEAMAIAAPLASPASPLGREMQRIQARGLLATCDAGTAVALYAPLTAADTADFESWDGLGMARLATGDVSGAVAALRRAIELRPNAVSYLINFARAAIAAADFNAAQDAAARAVTLAPENPAAHFAQARAFAGQRRYEPALASLARARAAAPETPELLSEVAEIEVNCRAFAAAEETYRAALALRADLPQAWIGLAKLFERLNRTPELIAALDGAEAAGVPEGATLLLRARAQRALGEQAEALATAQRAPEDVDPIGRAQLIGDIADRLGDADTAFAAFAEANARLEAGTVGAVANARAYLDQFAQVRALLTPERYGAWAPRKAAAARASPLFIFGFPRSGTTLIDTMLSGHPNAVVMEEEPVIDRLATALGPVDRVATLSQNEIEALTKLYFAEADLAVPDAGDRLLVDKNPLGLASTPLLHRLFPDARFVFVERHPCDVVLSCFITSSRMNANVGSFYDFTGTAELYDRVLSFWFRCREVLPIAVHTIRYETLIADPEPALRALAGFAGLDWDPRLLANERNASARSYIGSPSYAQVAEPLYTRARGRWLRYRRHMDPVLPILKPWIERLGYDLGDA